MIGFRKLLGEQVERREEGFNERSLEM